MQAINFGCKSSAISGTSPVEDSQQWGPVAFSAIIIFPVEVSDLKCKIVPHWRVWGEGVVCLPRSWRISTQVEYSSCETCQEMKQRKVAPFLNGTQMTESAPTKWGWNNYDERVPQHKFSLLPCNTAKFRPGHSFWRLSDITFAILSLSLCSLFLSDFLKEGTLD